MRSILIILILFCVAVAGSDLKERMSKLQRQTVQLLANDKTSVVPAEPVEVFAAPAPAPVPEARHPSRGGLTRVEIKQEYMDADIKELKKQMQDTKDLLQQIVITMEVQTKLAETGQDKTGRNEMIVNVLLAVFGFFMTGGAGYFGWKNKHIVFNRFKKAELEETKS